MSELQFVNINGDRVKTTGLPRLKRVAKETPSEYHRGWRVSGVSPKRVTDAVAEAAKKAARDRVDGKPVEDFNVELWIANASTKPVRPKAYGIPEAAEQCAELARKAGWRAVQVVELKKSAK